VAAQYQARLSTPLALIGVRTAGEEITEIVFLPPAMGALAPKDRLAERACMQIEKYASDPDYRFDLPLAAAGTEFQRRVWKAIAAIRRGELQSYGEMARRLRSAPRAVGQACGANPFPLVVPCHRVVSASGLGGFAHSEGGYLLQVKRRLLAHEGVL
jgi:methylated-DNA-[protein]-cysteine S-methyltransferase